MRIDAYAPSFPRYFGISLPAGADIGKRVRGAGVTISTSAAG